LGILANPAGNSEGFDKRNGKSNGMGGLRIWKFEGMKDNAFWKFRRKGGLKYGSRPWYGMDIFWNRPFPTTALYIF